MIPRTAYPRDARSAEGNPLRTTAAVIVDAERSRTRPQCLGRKSHFDDTDSTPCQFWAACVGLGEILWIGSGNGNSGDGQAARAHIGQSHSFRRTMIANRDRTEAQVGGIEFHCRCNQGILSRSVRKALHLIRVVNQICKAVLLQFLRCQVNLESQQTEHRH